MNQAFPQDCFIEDLRIHDGVVHGNLRSKSEGLLISATLEYIQEQILRRGVIRFKNWSTYSYDPPVPGNTMVEVIHKSGIKTKGLAGHYYWFYQGREYDIEYYRVITSDQE